MVDPTLVVVPIVACFHGQISNPTIACFPGRREYYAESRADKPKLEVAGRMNNIM